MTIYLDAEAIDKEIADKRWAAYPLLVKAVDDLLMAFGEPKPTNVDYNNVDRAFQLLCLLGEKKRKP